LRIFVEKVEIAQKYFVDGEWSCVRMNPRLRCFRMGSPHEGATPRSAILRFYELRYGFLRGVTAPWRSGFGSAAMACFN